ncbi:uncharacterized protein Z519_03661 [Cladophialophora bantiana CBS 173.52]|uniref:Aminoglycoside phosphotransferase domain-containing protein n=1 Tax=Cladophialophora bantiana (strain ATCC 10958 / CBS 173.52 / CDC B-1940 / NIH 8579) TaxID=1442370 RepID=A0A0D2HNW3_CLAB1|nr:uncharacterized protein Z519_03661 [Cladophialophora bantiana CBS 173.52]KIW95078.1 hypothetical protein Z519_03661 [Cladophialophora bantiana CBS 173.52]
MLDEWLGRNPDTFEGVPETALSTKGCLEVIMLAMQSIPPYLRRPECFQIDFWDYNYQNIFIDGDCNITGILDWDGDRAVPQEIGCTRCPS